MVENVEKIATTQSPTPPASASAGHRYARHGRRRKTSAPTIASESTINPSRRRIDAASQ